MITADVQPMKRLSGKVALVTGGNSGIGRRTVRRLVEEGAFVYATGRNQQTFDAVAAEFGESVEAARADSMSRDDLRALADRIRERHGRLDLVFANAGAAWYGTVDELSPEDIDHGLELDVEGTIFTVQATLPLLVEGGSIVVNTTSTLLSSTIPRRLFRISRIEVLKLSQYRMAGRNTSNTASGGRCTSASTGTNARAAPQPRRRMGGAMRVARASSVLTRIETPTATIRMRGSISRWG